MLVFATPSLLYWRLMFTAPTVVVNGGRSPVADSALLAARPFDLELVTRCLMP
jgi:hypothetical protein